MPSAASALRNRNFALLALARAISTFGTALAPVALAFAVIELGGTTSDLGIVLSATLAPQVAFLLLGGVWADRLPRHYVMVGSDLASAVAQAVMAGLLLSGHAAIWHLAILGAIRGTASAFFFPASTGAVPQTVPVDQLQRANAILRMSTNTATVTGGGIGGIVVAAAGPGIAIAVDAATYGVAALLVAFISLPRAAKVAGTPFVRQLAEGWAEFRSRRWIWAIIAQFAFINAFGTGAFLVLGPFVAERSLGGPAAWGAIVAAQSLGMAAAAFAALRFHPGRPLRTATASVFLFAAPLALLAGPAPAALIVAAALVAGFGLELFTILWDTALQHHIPEDKLSRVSAYDYLGSFALIPVGTAIVGPIASVVGVRTTLAAAAAIVITATAAVLALPEVRRLPRRTAVPADAELSA